MTTKSLTWKTTWRFAGLVTATTMTVLAAGGWLVDRQMRRGLALLHEGEARELLGFLAGAERTPEAVKARVLRDSEGDAEWFFIQIHDGNGTVLFRSPSLGAAVLPDLGPAMVAQEARLPGVGKVLLSEVREDGWHIQVASPLTAQQLLIDDYIQVSLLLSALAACVALALGYAFARVTLRPVRRIAETARRMSGENLKERVPPGDTKDELAELGGILNQTFDRLEASFAQVSRFAADASHELKTPLSLMRLNAERLRSRLSQRDDEAEELDDLLEALDRTHQVIDRLLFLARADGGALHPAQKAVEVRRLIADFAQDASAILEETGASFVVVSCDDGELRGDETLLRQLLLNLVTNAARVSPRGGSVELKALRGPASWLLTMTDEGPGLPEEGLERIFERFVRVETKGPSSPSTASGHGLGLAICRSIVKLHGGTITARNRPDGRGGLCVILELPIGK